jgi:hypothetical protein
MRLRSVYSFCRQPHISIAFAGPIATAVGRNLADLIIRNRAALTLQTCQT